MMSDERMLNQFLDYVEEQHLFSTGEQVLLAVSGGRDSVCLAHLMHAAGYPFAIAHCNFHLRPGDCDRDQAFVRQLAADRGVAFYTTDFDTQAVARAKGMSVEEAARELRYNWFVDLCEEHGISTLATAHHRDDSIETFFLNLMRGTGIAGLRGIPPQSERLFLRIVRPMLCFYRSDIDAFVEEHHLPYVEDVTNAQLDARRNCIRHQLMPLLRELYPAADRTMWANMQRLSDTAEVYRAAVEELQNRLLHHEQSPFGFDYCYYYLGDLRELHPQATLLFELLRPFGFTAAVVADIVAALPNPHTGAQFRSPDYVAFFDRERLMISEYEVLPPPKVRVESGQWTVTSDQWIVYVDADAVRQPFSVRRWQAGDRFHPLGMEHSRLVSDFLKDASLNPVEKRNVYLLVDADGRVVWVMGLRIDHRVRVTEATRTVLKVTSEFGH